LCSPPCRLTIPGAAASANHSGNEARERGGSPRGSRSRVACQNDKAAIVCSSGAKCFAHAAARCPMFGSGDRRERTGAERRDHEGLGEPRA